MRARTTALLIGVGALILMACGGDTGEVPDCGDESVYDEESKTCVARKSECGPGEVHDRKLGRCVRSGESYCGEGTVLDEAMGQCVPVSEAECAENTVEEQGQCIPRPAGCGSGTVAYDGLCLPADDICGDGTDGEPGVGDACEPEDDVCGRGTSFDVAIGQCVLDDELECGPGTVEEEGLCVPLYDFYSEMADDPDLDMTAGDEEGEITVGDRGERFSFVGQIDEPEYEAGQPVQDTDHYTFEGEAGDWIRVTVFSLGLPEPGFFVESTDEVLDYRRWSDLGAGVEVRRDLLLPADGIYELTVSNMPQLLGNTVPAGGSGWEYVGYVERLEPIEALEVDPFEEGLEGELMDVTDNFYTFDDFDGETLKLLFDVLPVDAEMELQVWSDEETLEASRSVEEHLLVLDELDEESFLYLDRVFSFGASTAYVAAALEGEMLEDGDSLSESIELEAGEYLGVFQFNPDGHSLPALIGDGSGALASTQELSIIGAAEGDPSLYWYAEEDSAVNVVLENDVGTEIETVDLQTRIGQADAVHISEGVEKEVDYAASMQRGQRHYIELDVDFEGVVGLSVDGAGASVGVYDESGTDVAFEYGDLTLVDVKPKTYIAYVEAEEMTSSGLRIHIEDWELSDWSKASNPEIPIPVNDMVSVDDTVIIPSCPIVESIDMDVEILHPRRVYLEVSLSNPEGDTELLKARYGGALESDIVGNFNDTLEPAYSSFLATGPAVPIDTFEGASGTGEWTLHVSNHIDDNFAPGTVESWTLNLECTQ